MTGEQIALLAGARFAALDLPPDSHGWLQAVDAVTTICSERRIDHARVSGMLRDADGSTVRVWAWARLADGSIVYLDRASGSIASANATDPRFEDAHVLRVTYP